MRRTHYGDELPTNVAAAIAFLQDDIALANALGVETLTPDAGPAPGPVGDVTTASLTAREQVAMAMKMRFTRGLAVHFGEMAKSISTWVKSPTKTTVPPSCFAEEVNFMEDCKLFIEQCKFILRTSTSWRRISRILTR